MARYFRCEEPTGECPHSLTREVQIDRPGVCPIGNPECERWRSPVPLLTALRERNPALAWGAAGLLGLILLALLLSALLGGGGWKSDLVALQADLDRLDGRLSELDEQIAPPRPPPSPEAWDDLLTAASQFEQQINRAQASDASVDLPALRTDLRRLDGELSRLLASTGPAPNSAVRTASAGQLVRDYEAIEERAENARNLAPTGDDAAEMAFEDLIAQLRDGMNRARRLTQPAPSPNAPPQQLADIRASLEASRAAIAEIGAKPALPFPPESARLTIATTPELARSLVLPLLQARFANGQVSEEQQAGRWFVATTDPAIAPGALINVRAADPYDPLVDGSADLVITDEEPDATVRAQFKERFNGEELDSRAFSEVVALDAVALLAHPDASAIPVDLASLAAQPWLASSDQVESLQRRVGKALTLREVADPLHALIADTDARALALYHQCKPGLAARFLPLQPAADARALAASPFTIATEDYALAYRIIGAVAPQAPAARKFLDYLTSDPGQDRIAEAGFVDLRLRHRQDQVDPTILAVLAQALGLQSIAGASRYSTNLRFRVDEHRLDIKAQADLGRLPRSLARDFPNGKVVILGFTDSSGSAEHNHGLSIKRAEFIAAELKPFGIDAAAAGLGQQLPIDTNETEPGRMRNRRAEVWVVKPEN